MHQYNTTAFTVGEAVYNENQNKQICPQVGCTVFNFTAPWNHGNPIKTINI